MSVLLESPRELNMAASSLAAIGVRLPGLRLYGKLPALARDGLFDVQIAGAEKRQRRAKSAHQPPQFAGDQHKGAGNRGSDPCQPVQHGASLTWDRKQAFNGRRVAKSSAQRAHDGPS